MQKLAGSELKLQQLRALLVTATQGKITPAHTDDEHWYKIADHTGKERLVASVTTQISSNKPYLIKWAIKVGYEWLKENDPNMMLTDKERLVGMQQAFENVRDHSSMIGTVTHNALEKYLRHWIITNNQPPDAMKFVDKTFKNLT